MSITVLDGTAGITVAGVKNCLVGLDGWLAAAAASAANYSDATILQRISDAVSEFTVNTNVMLQTVQVCMTPDGVYDGPDSWAVGASVPVIIRHAMTYFRDDIDNLFAVTLPFAPVLEVQRLRLMLGSQVIYTVPNEWFDVDPRSGDFHLLPVGGATLAAAAGAWYQAAVLSGVTSSRNMPAVIAFDFVAGLPANWQTDPTRAIMRLRIEEKAAVQVLSDISELYDAGLLSASTNQYGLSQQVNYSRFAQRRADLEARVAKFEKTFADKNAAPLFASL